MTTTTELKRIINDLPDDKEVFFKVDWTSAHGIESVGLYMWDGKLKEDKIILVDDEY